MLRLTSITLLLLSSHFLLSHGSKNLPVTTDGLHYNIGKIKTKKKIVALTFDDGPYKNVTPKVIKILKEHDIKATFFLVGLNIKYFPKSLKMLLDEGHELGNHSYKHENFSKMSDKAILASILKTQEIFNKTIKQKPIYYRPPYGIRQGLSTVRKYFEKIIFWSVDSKDWKKHITDKKIINNIMSGLSPGSIILMHENKRTARVLPQVIKRIKSKGYSFLIISEFLKQDERYLGK